MTREELLKVRRMYNALLANGFSKEQATTLVPILGYESRGTVNGEQQIFVQDTKDPESESYGLVQVNLSSMGPAIYKTMVDVGYDLPPGTTREQEMQMSHNREGTKDNRQFTEEQRGYVSDFLKSLDIEEAAVMVKNLFWQKQNEKMSYEEGLKDLYFLTIEKFEGRVTTDPTAIPHKNAVDEQILYHQDKLDSDVDTTPPPEFREDARFYFNESNQREFESQVPKEAGSYQDARFKTDMRRPTEDPVRGQGRFEDARGRRIIQREILEYLYHHGIKKADALKDMRSLSSNEKAELEIREQMKADALKEIKNSLRTQPGTEVAGVKIDEKTRD